MRGGRQVGIADAEANDIDPAGGNFAFFLVYFSEQVGRQFLQAGGFSDRNRHRLLRQRGILAIFSFFDNPLRSHGWNSFCYTGSAKACAAFSTISRPIAREAVAPGEGAFRTCRAFPVMAMMKSSTSAPLVAIACARTPLPPGCRSAMVRSGRRRWSAFKKARLLNERYISPMPVRQYLRDMAQIPGKVNVSRRSNRSQSVVQYPSRANARTAFGPASTKPSMVRVK